MRRAFVVAAFAPVWMSVLGTVSASATDHLLITEVGVWPTNCEFVEIHNPTSAPVDLTDYYLSDFVLAFDPTVNYWRHTDGALFPPPDFPFDFLARFPAGALIGPGETRVIAVQDDVAFSAFWLSYQGAVTPDFELAQDVDGVANMVDPGPATIGVPLIQFDALLSNSGEVVVLFHWDGMSDLVQDIDIVQWSGSGPERPTISPNKTGVSVDGPDGDGVASTYDPDTARPLQDLAATALPDIGRTFRRLDLTEGTETLAGGNGISGHDETSENLSVTWAPNSLPTIGHVDGPVSVTEETWGRLKAWHRSARDRK